MKYLKILIHLLILRPLIALFFGVNTANKENLKNLNKFIIIANHNSHLDILLLFYILPLREIPNTYSVAAKEYFSKSKIVLFLVNFLFNTICIERGNISKENDPLKLVIDKINEGKNIIIFPEGTRGKPGEIQHFKSGFGRLMEKYPGIPVVPVFLSGPERALPKGAIIPIPLWNNITVGGPVTCKGSHVEITRSVEKIVRLFAEKESALAHKRITRADKNAKLIGVLGIDGSGKSTVSKNLSKLLSSNSVSALISDDLEIFENGGQKKKEALFAETLREAISARAKTAKSLKSYKIPKLTEIILRDLLVDEIIRWHNPEYIILDGCPLLNLTAWSIIYKEKYFNEASCLKAVKVLSGNDGNINNTDPIFKNFPELKAMKSLRLNKLKIPDIVILLNIDPGKAVARIEQRQGKKQVHETEDKLKKLSKAYHTVCGIINRNLNIPVFIMDGNSSVDNVTNTAFENIKKYLKGKGV